MPDHADFSRGIRRGVFAAMGDGDGPSPRRLKGFFVFATFVNFAIAMLVGFTIASGIVGGGVKRRETRDCRRSYEAARRGGETML